MTASSTSVRWGVIGCGQIAVDKVMPGLVAAPNAEIVAIADPDEARLAMAASIAPQAHSYHDPEALLTDRQVDAVYIAVPNALHATLTIQAAGARKHVLVEKPMAMNLDESRQMVAACDHAGVKLMVAYMALFNPAYQMALRVVQEGMLGTIVFARGRHSYAIRPDQISNAAAWRLDRSVGGGPLMDVALYPAITVRHLVGQPIRRVAAIGVTRQLAGHTTTWDSVVTSFVMADETPGVLEATFTHWASLIELEGERGRLALTDHITQTASGRLEVFGRGERLVHENLTADLPHFEPYRREVEHFSACVLDGREPIASGRDVLAEMALADAVRASIETGQTTTVEW
jgi:xylose dehydrogenase (NAD/NADP)